MKPIVLLGESPSAAEERLGVSFCSSGGLELLKMLSEAEVITLTAADQDYIRRYWNATDPEMLDMVWRLHPEVQRLNVFPALPGNSVLNILGPKPTAIPGYPNLEKGANGYVQLPYADALRKLERALNSLDANIVVCLGNTPLWALCGTTGVSKLRGTTRMSTHTVADFKVLATYHPATVLRQIELRSVTVFDLMKAVRENESPKLMLPEREIWIEPTIKDIEVFYEHRIRGSDLLSVDIETSGNQITCIGFAPDARSALVVPFFDSRRKGRSYWGSTHDESVVWSLVRNVLTDRSIPKLFHNALYDTAFLWRAQGIPTYNVAQDTMLMHHALQPESLKSLGFLGSVYCAETAWKTEHRNIVMTNKRDA